MVSTSASLKVLYNPLKGLDGADPIQKLHAACMTGRPNSYSQYHQTTLKGNKTSVEIRKKCFMLKDSTWVSAPAKTKTVTAIF